MSEDIKYLNHNIRNPLIGIALELKNMSKSCVKIEEHIKRIDRAIRDYGTSEETNGDKRED